ncbi:putative 2,4-dienoyl-CoA reductase [Alphaproteobacteria bacterium SO-S41]|nr:putative 2,4-dienoyl-CoA reductase [Alphaproteobacteria bacterium SO-S41]
MAALQAVAPMLPPDCMAGTRVLVTGGGTGLGLGMALAFARLGAHVVLASRNADNRAKGLAAFTVKGLTGAEVFLDTLQPETIESAFAAHGPFDILVNNAAANFYAPAETLSANGWSTIVDRVLKGSFACAQVFARQALAARRPGAILNIVSGPGLDGGPGVAASAAAKAGLINLTKSLAVEWARDGIRVNALCPGIFPHDDDSPEAKDGRVHFTETIGDTIPLGRVGQIHEAAWLATYLCSSYAAYMTGHVAVLDGGARLPRSTALRQPFHPVRDGLPTRNQADAAPRHAPQKCK